MVFTSYRITDEDSGEILKEYRAVIVKNQSDRTKALAMFPNFVEELVIELGGNRNPQSIFLFK